jgi:hypothetical protein
MLEELVASLVVIIEALMDAVNRTPSPQVTSAERQLKRLTKRIKKRRQSPLLELPGDDTTYDRYAPPALPTRSKRIAATEHIYLISRLLREVSTLS